MVNIPYMSKYQHSSPRRKDSGTYKIQAVNKYGQDTAELEIIVICKCLCFETLREILAFLKLISNTVIDYLQSSQVHRIF